jgi:protocatechuate 3,4-dioxygenase beta subunit
MKLHVTIKAGFLALALMLAFGSTVLAQEETAATVTGQVTDSTGALIKAATVVITNERTQQERRLQTNDDGQFVVTPLVPGTYTH